MKPRSRLTTAHGYTLIEVLIVLVIAMLILLIVFMIVPAAKRNERNFERRHFVDFTAAALEEHVALQGTAYPDTPAEMCTFIMRYLRKSAGGGGSCDPSYASPQKCVLVDFSRFTICYHDRDESPHSYIGPEDEISIQLGHWCTPNPNPWPADNGHPITSGADIHDNNTRRYVIWTKLEGADIYCRDNYPAH